MSDSKFPAAQYLKAHKLNSEGLTLSNDEKKYAKAAKKFQQAIEMCPEADKISKKLYILNLGKCYYNMKDYDKAIESHDKALAIDSQFNLAKNSKADALNRQGDILKDAKNYSQAVLKYQQALDVCGEGYDKCFCLTVLGLCYVDMEDYKRAFEYFDEALANNDQYEFARSQKAFIMNEQGMALLSEEKYFDAIKLFTQSFECTMDCERKPEYKENVKTCAIGLKRQGDEDFHVGKYKEALIKYEKVSEKLNSDEHELKSQVENCIEKTKLEIEAFTSYELGLKMIIGCGEIDKIITEFRNATYKTKIEKNKELFKFKYEEALNVQTKLKNLQLIFEKLTN